MLNKSLFEKAGASDLLPNATTRAWSRDQFAKAVQKIGALGNGTYGFGLAVGAKDHDKFMDGFIYSDGDEQVEKEFKKITYNTPKNAANLDWLINVATSKEAVPGVTGNKISNVFELFKQGKVGIMNTNTGYADEIRKGLKDGSIKGPLELMYAQFPTGDGSVGKTYVGGNGFAIKKQEDKAKMEEAAKFIMWMTSGKDADVNEASYVKTVQFPARKSLQHLITDPEEKVLSGMPKKAIINVNMIPNYQQMRQNWFNSFQPAFLKDGKMTASQALANYEKDNQKQLDEGNAKK
jgi:ABC-type glycerol-3-phosphate transport system substrate-binding protein